MSITFRKHFVKNATTGAKARVRYSKGSLISRPGVQCVTIYAKDHGEQLSKVFASGVQNDTELVSDYFETDRVRIFEDDALFPQVIGLAS